ncbi:MAG: threonylcarbamoyl-AMP synthase [Paludibacteraceae bacterium]|nr:threonylcarbamoyl-AMP synthase [Paludibacteraceae bacterium]MBO7234782.1 threonylcarbamoyl-AMP synthase [Paludibacteraceae bacterium]MBO7259747.1 threonylcarbamoyl-AMP synthase [Paludibacteraceae bacterium]
MAKETSVRRYDAEDLKEALRIVQQGGVILYPTDTVWGIGCDATNEEAVKRVYQIKQRIDSKSMLVLIDNPARLTSYIDEVPDMAWTLVDISDKPLTIIYPGAKNLAPSLLAEDGSVGIRVTSELFSSHLCSRLNRPLVSTSANLSGAPTPSIYAEISDEIKESVDYIVRYRQDDTHKATPSSIIKLGIGNLVEIIRA